MIRYTRMGDIKIGKQKGMMCFVSIQLSMKSRGEFAQIARFINTKFNKAKVGLPINSQIIQMDTSEPIQVSDWLESNRGEDVADHRLSFTFMNGIDIDPNLFQDKLHEIFVELIDNFDGIEVVAQFMDSDAVCMSKW